LRRWPWAFGRDRFWFNSGVWYRPYGGGYRVVLPPFGAVVPLLPPDYVTVRLGGLPYFYANGVYYAAYDAGPGYVVVAGRRPASKTRRQSFKPRP